MDASSLNLLSLFECSDVDEDRRFPKNLELLRVGEPLESEAGLLLELRENMLFLRFSWGGGVWLREKRGMLL